MTEVLERGDVFFFYRPRVGVEEVRGAADVARLLFVLDPDGRSPARLVVVGRKRLPDPARHERAWAFVDAVAERPDALRDALLPRTYETRTRGVRVRPAARPAGEGRYALATHERHSHLAYGLELPPEPGEAQRLLNIRREASFIAAVRNPDAPAPAGTGLPRRSRPQLPPELRERFGDRRGHAIDDPALLDHPGVELVLIGAREDVESELGIALDLEAEGLATAELFTDLRLRPGDVPEDALVRGRLR
jgi:hypothetical protein